MFNSTHTLVGLAAARTGVARWVPHAAWTAMIASNLPDIDIFTAFAGTPMYIEYHRGITHTLAGVPALSLLLAAIMHAISGNFRRHFLLALLVMASHPMLDLANTYGIRPFVPFAQTWFYADTLFVIDPFLDLILLTGVLASFLVRPRGRELSARISLILAIAYAGARLELRDLARARLAEYVPSVSGYQRSAVSPRMLTLQVFTGIIETSGEIFTVELHAFRGVTGELTRIPKARPSDVVSRANSSRVGAVFHSFARFPVARVDELASGYRVTLIDVRYYQEATHTAFAGTIFLDASLHVIGESLGFNQPVE